MNKRKIAFIANSLICILEVYALMKYVKVNHTLSLEYYTMDSNLLSLMSSFLFIIFYKKTKERIKDFRFISTCCLTVTFLVVLFILVPMMNFNYKALLLDNELLFLHTICPIISIISYVFFEERSNKKNLGIIFTIMYSLILIPLNIIGVVDGPYPFLRIKEQSIWMTIIWGVIIIGGSYIIGIGLNTLNKINNKK